MLKKIFFFLLAAGIFCFPSSLFAENILKTGGKAQPMTINGDTVEYSADAQEVTASGNVEIISGDSKLTCQKITVNTQTKEGVASGHVKLEDSKGIIEGEKIIYNFQNKTGTIIDAQFRANPFFGKARKIDRESENEFVAHYGYATTCSFDRPHYRISSKQINVMPKQLIQTKDDYFYIGPFPVGHLDYFNQMFDKPVMHVSVLPGRRKDWGPFLLSEGTYNINQYLDGRAYLDYRVNLGWAEGLGLNYAKTPIGDGDFKYYYTNESSHNYPNRTTMNYKNASFQRYLVRFRDKWDIDKQTNFITQIYKIGDDKRKFVDPNANFIQDYFYREFEKDSQPLTYASFHHSFSYSSIDLLVQKRINHWFNSLDKLPEIRYTLSSLQIGETPFFVESNSVFDNFNNKSGTFTRSDGTIVALDNVVVSRLDTFGKISLPTKVAFFNVNPFVKIQETAYDKDVNNQTLPVRSIFYTGVDVSTKFYRVLDVKTNFLGLDLDRLRHVITPSIGYSYNPEPTISSNKLKQIDSIDALTSSNAMNLELSNKLQTKRKDKDGKEVNVDLVDLDITSSYTFAPRITYGTDVLYQNNIAVNQTNNQANIINKHKK